MPCRISIMLRKNIDGAAVALVLAAGKIFAAPPALSDLGQGITAYNARNFAGAIPHLVAARDVAKLSDYTSYYLAYARLLTGDVDGAVNTLTAYRANPVDSSPLAG